MENTRRTIAATLARAVATWPDRPAVVCETRTLTFAELDVEARQRLAALQAQGVSPGDFVLVMLDNTEQAVITWLALALGGCIDVPVNTALVGDTLSHVLDDSGARTVITDPPYVDRLVAARDGALRRVLVLDGQPTPDGLVRPLTRSSASASTISRDELADTAVMYTSGTTGPAKGAVICERHAYEYAAAAAEVLGLSEGDVYYAPLPLFHIAGRWGLVYASLQRGACAVVVRRFSLGSFWSDVRENRATVSFLLGAMAQFVLSQPERDDDPVNPLERVLMVPLINDLDQFRARFGTLVTTCFASTEANVPLAASWDCRVDGGVGRVRPGYAVRLVDSDGKDVNPGEPGELLVATDEDGMVVRRYHDNPTATEAALRDGWLHTGDVFACTGEDYVFVDRLKDALRRRGENISSFEVERELKSHSSVVECAVVGVDSAHSEQEVAAFVQLAPGEVVRADELRRYVAARAPKYLVPDHIRFVDQMPLTPTGKIQKFLLVEQFGSTPTSTQIEGTRP